jgi:prephenate dehydrogenase
MAVPLALALRARAAAHAVDLVADEARTLAAAREHGLVTAPRASLLEGPADAVFLCVPPAEIEEQVAEWSRLAPGALHMSLSAVQRPALAAARRVQERDPGFLFVCASPILDGDDGGARRGADAFLGRPVALCALPGAPPAALASAEALWLVLGAVPVALSAEEHDRRLALTGHLPFVTAAALAGLAAHSIAPESHADFLLGPTFLDATRAAGGPAPRWSAIVAANGDQVAAAARALARSLGVVADLLDSDPATPAGARQNALAAWAEPGAAFRRRLGER